MMTDNRHYSHRLRSAIHYCKHIDTEGILQLGFLVQQIFQSLDICSLFQLQNNTDSLFGRLVGNIGNVTRCLGFYQTIYVI